MIRRAGQASACLFLLGCSAPPSAVKTASEPKPEPARVLQFYAAPAVIARGDRASLCYGVENATAVRVDPPVKSLRPAYSYCFPVSPRVTTAYTLSVDGADGRTFTRTAEVVVDPSAPSAADGAKPADSAASTRVAVASFTASPAEVAAGGLVTLCFTVVNATQVRLDPPVQPLGAAQHGCFSITPPKTTTYTLIATGKGGQTDRRELTVQVR